MFQIVSRISLTVFCFLQYDTPRTWSNSHFLIAATFLGISRNLGLRRLFGGRPLFYRCVCSWCPCSGRWAAPPLSESCHHRPSDSASNPENRDYPSALQRPHHRRANFLYFYDLIGPWNTGCWSRIICFNCLYKVLCFKLRKLLVIRWLFKGFLNVCF